LHRGQFGYVLQQIGTDETDEVARILNALSHKTVYYYESDLVVPQALFSNVMDRLLAKYNSILHAE
jgi:hypothetical protein